MRTAGTQIAKRAAQVLLSLVVLTISLEIVLQALALFVSDRSDVADGVESRFRVLALGDSHTYGADVGAEESYPGRLQALLDEHSPSTFSVINKGIPGFSTAQVRSRLARNVHAYDPQLVLFWAGINDTWNVSELYDGEASWIERLDGYAGWSRVYKMLRVWGHDRQLETAFESESIDESRPRIEQISGGRWRIHWGDVVEEGHTEQREMLADATHARRVEANYEAMVTWLKAAGICAAFIEYPIRHEGFAAANRAMQRVAERHGLPIVVSNASIQRIPLGERELLWALHPSARMYDEIARDIVPVVLAARSECSRESLAPIERPD